MNRFASAWNALRGKSAAPGVVFGDPKTAGAMNDLLSGAIPFGAPPRRGERELMIAHKRNPVMHSILGRIGYDIGSTPWQLFLARNKATGAPEKRVRMDWGAKECRKAYRIEKATGQLRKDIEEIEDHPLLDLLHRFNPLMTGLIGMGLTQKYIDLKGEAFLGIERNAAGMPVQLWPIPGYWIYRTPFAGSPFFNVSFGAWVASIPETEIIWLKHPDLENPYWRGSGIGESLGDEIEIDEYAGKTQKALFYNHNIPSAVISLDGAGQPVVDRVREDFNQKHGGFWNAAKVFWVGQKIDVKTLAMDFTDSNIGPLRKDERDKMVSTYGVPPEILGILDHSNRATIAEAKTIYAEHVLVPRLEFTRTELQERLVPEFDERLLLDYVDPSPDDQSFKLQVATAAPYSRTVNEWRELQSLPPLDGPEGEARPPMPVAPPPPADKETAKPGTADPPLPKSLRRWLSRAAEEDDTLRAEQLDDVMGSLDDSALVDGWASVAEPELKSWVEQVGKETGLELDFDLVNPKISEYVRQRSLDKVKGLGKANATTRDQLRASLSEGIDAGESIRDLSARVRDVFEDAQGYRATNIARTETTRAAGWGNVTAFKEGGAEAKEWVATRDTRTREDHVDMDGQVVAIDEPFETPGGLEGDHPGDFDDPEEDCGCRCTVSVAEKSEIDGDDEKAMRSRRKKTLERRDAAWKFYDAAVTPWETKTRKAVRKAFGIQRAAVLAALEKAAA